MDIDCYGCSARVAILFFLNPFLVRIDILIYDGVIMGH